MSSQKSSTRKSGDIEEGLPKNSREDPSIYRTNDYKVVRRSSTRTRKSPPKPHNPAVIESTRKAIEFANRTNAADKIQKHWRNYKRRHPKEPAFQKLIRTSLNAVSRNLSKLLNLKGGKRTRRQKR